MKTALLLGALLACTTSFAQHFILSFGGGGDAPIARVYTGSYQGVQSSMGSSNFVQRVKPVSLGQGGNIFIALDWFSKKDIGCGLKINGFFGAPFKYTNEQISGGNTQQYTVSQRGWAGQFIPHISFKHDFDKICPVLEVGMVIGANAIEEKYEGYYNVGNQILSTAWQKGGVSLGFYSSLGMWVRLSRTVRFSVAATCIAASYSPTHWERTSFKINGVDNLSQLAVSDRYGNYVTQLTSNSNTSANSPRQSLKYSAPFSNVGLNVGFAFILDKRNGHTSKPKGAQEVHSF